MKKPGGRAAIKGAGRTYTVLQSKGLGGWAGAAEGIGDRGLAHRGGRALVAPSLASDARLGSKAGRQRASVPSIAPPHHQAVADDHETRYGWTGPPHNQQIDSVLDVFGTMAKQLRHRLERAGQGSPDPPRPATMDRLPRPASSRARGNWGIEELPQYMHKRPRRRQAPGPASWSSHEVSEAMAHVDGQRRCDLRASGRPSGA